MTHKTFLIFYLLFSAFNSFGQDKTDEMIRAMEDKLNKRVLSVTDVLTDKNLLPLHSLTAFREIIKRNAQPGLLAIVTANEPGTRITVKGSVVSSSGTPLPNALVYFYHTSAKGWYSDTAVHISGNEGDHRHARLFGYLKTDHNGEFVLTTVRPQGYPKSDLAAHIHIQLWDSSGRLLTGASRELQFEDDPRMTPSRRQRSLSEGFLIASNQGSAESPVYAYRIVTGTE